MRLECLYSVSYMHLDKRIKLIAGVKFMVIADRGSILQPWRDAWQLSGKAGLLIIKLINGCS